MRPLCELRTVPLREWTADELTALRSARVMLRRTTTRTPISRPPGYVLNDHDALDMRLLDAVQVARLLAALEDSQEAQS